MDETDFSTLPTPDLPHQQQQQQHQSSASSSQDAARRASRVFCCGDPLNVKSLLSRPGGAVQIVANASHTHRRLEPHPTDEVGDTAGTCVPHDSRTTTIATQRPSPSITANGTASRTVALPSSSTTSHSSSNNRPPLAPPQSHQPPAQSAAGAHLLVADHKGRVQFLSDNHLDELGTTSGSSSGDANESRRRPPTATPSLVATETATGACRASSSSGADDDWEEEGDDGGSAESMPSTSDRTQDDLIQFVFTSHGIRVISDKEYVV